jgi:L-2-hydroxyglutarate oxidase LhgO
MDRIDCIVIGAGVIGLAAARALALQGREVLILEAADAIGTGTSSRNSEVIHAGIYYPTGLTKTRLCVAGKQMLYDFCESHHVPHRRCGKLLVATREAERAKLTAIKALAEANGVHDLTWLAPEEVRAIEPAISCVAALMSPSTGIIDSHALMLALLGDAEAHGAMLALDSPVTAGKASDEGILITAGTDEPVTLLARTVINAAGLGAQQVARAIEGMPAALIPPQFLAKGNYYTLGMASPFRHLIYPMPEGGGLGVHVTLDMGGQARFGPDVEWVETIDYVVDPKRADAFYAAIRSYWPGLPDGVLHPGYSGIRPKIEKPGGPNTDFVIQGPESHGIAGLVNLFGIESPGLTACLALANTCLEKLGLNVGANVRK